MTRPLLPVPASVAEYLDTIGFEAAPKGALSGARAETDRLRTEVERLSLDRDEWRSAAQGRERLEAEAERLRIEVRNASDTLIRQGQIMHGLAKQVARVRALPHRDHYTEHGGHHGECVDDDALRAALDGEAT